MLPQNTALVTLKNQMRKKDKDDSVFSKFTNVEWIDVKDSASRLSKGLPVNTIVAGTIRSGSISRKLSRDFCNYLTFRFSADIVKQLGWKPNDYIYVGISPHSDLHFYCKKLTNSIKGFKIVKHLKKSNDLMLTFAAKESKMMKRLKDSRCEFLVNPQDESVIILLSAEFTPLSPLVVAKEIEKNKGKK